MLAASLPSQYHCTVCWVPERQGVQLNSGQGPGRHRWRPMATTLLPGPTGSRAESSRAEGSSRSTGARPRRQWQTVSSWVSCRLPVCVGSCCQAVWRRMEAQQDSTQRRRPRRRCRRSSFSAAATHRRRLCLRVQAAFLPSRALPPVQPPLRATENRRGARRAERSADPRAGTPARDRL